MDGHDWALLLKDIIIEILNYLSAALFPSKWQSYHVFDIWETRRNLDQSKEFDSPRVRYSAGTNDEESSLLRENTFKLCGSRKEYLKASSV